MEGKIHALHRKHPQEGTPSLPKDATRFAAITKRGMVGDHNRFLTNKRGSTPDRAILLYTLDALAQLNAEGWPVRAGDLGENVTLEGIPYADLREGSVYDLGQARIELTQPATPCKNLATLPYVGEKAPDFIKTMVGRRGWYARVLEEGTLVEGAYARERMRFLYGEEAAQAKAHLQAAVEEAKRSPCHKSHRGVIVADGDRIIARGHNAPPQGYGCDGSCREFCAKHADHAEMQALWKVRGQDLSRLRFYHIKEVDGKGVSSGPPSCIACSKELLCAGVGEFVLAHDEGIALYDLPTFHRLSMEYHFGKPAIDRLKEI